MIGLTPMTDTEYNNFLEILVSGYAEDNIESGRWSKEVAFKRSKTELDKDLPQGLETPNNHILIIRNMKMGIGVGHLWVKITENFGEKSAWISDVYIIPEFRRRGFAKAAFKSLDIFSKKLGVTSIGLHVFSHNDAAQALYRKLGYDTTGINMIKKLPINND